MRKVGYVRVTCKNCDKIYNKGSKDATCPNCGAVYVPFTRREAAEYRRRKILMNVQNNLHGGNDSLS